MRHRLQLALFVSLFVPLLGFAAVFDTDDFDDGIRDPIKWILPDKLSGGFLSETNSHLEFSCSSFGGDASATWASGLPTASNWVISLDVAIAVPMRGPELVRWEVLVSPPGIPYQKHFTVGFQQTGPELSDHSCTYEAFANGVLATKGSTNVSDFQGTLRLRYAAADNLIFAEYRTPGTTNFSLLAMYSTVGWDLHTIPVLTATLHASSISLPVTSGSMYVDNFAVSTPQQMPTSAPQIIARPRSRPAVVGNSVEFQVAASGYPLAYQWSFNGQAITDATNSVLRLSNVTTNKSGLYSVAISNALDTVSSTAQLTVYRSFSVALYGDADFVDYSSYYPISFPPDLFGVLTQPFTRSIADAITNQAIIFPCLRRDPSTWLGWTNALQSFVRQGGIMITTGSGAAEMLNRVFGFSLVALDGPGVFARTAQAQGTIFEFGPEYLPNDVDEREAPPHCRSALISASLPLGARDLYHQDASAQSVVAFMPFGSGGVVYMGWDTYNSAPFGLGDRGWFETMGNALSLRGGLPLTAPIITAQPRSQERLALEDVTFVVSANGSVPIRAQWFFENKLISGATNNALNLQSVAMNQTGNYFAVISNAYGSVTSQVAHLEVRPTRGVVGILQQAYATSLAAFIEGAGFTPVVFSSITNCDLSRLDMLMIDSFSFNEGVELKRRLPEIRKWIIHGGKLISHQWSEILPESVVLSPSTGLGLGIVPPGDNLVVNGPHGMLDLIPLDGTFRHDGAALSQSLPARALPILNDGSETNIVAFSYSIGLGSVFYSSLEFLSYAEGPGKVQEILRNVYLPNLLEHAASFSVSGAPVVVQQSSDTTAFLSTGVSLYVGANGQMPLSYQWLHDGIMVANATNAFLYLTNLSLAHAGSYTVLLSNSFDVVASHSLILNPIPQPLLRIAALTGNLPQALDPVSLIGRGRGGIAVSSSNIFYTGEIGTGRFPISFAGIRANIGLPYCSFVSDLRTEKVYLLLDQSNLLVSTGHLTALNEINPDGSFTTNRVELSTPIKLGYDTTIFAGLEGPVLATDNKVYRIALPSGAVMDLGVIPSLGRTTCAWCSWGVAETYSNSVYLVYVRDSQTVVRTHVPSGVTTVLSSFANLGDVCAFTVSPKLGRWYFHSAGASQFAGGESIVAASASFDQPPRITGTLTNRTILEDSATGPIPFFMNDAESPANQIVGTVAAANSLLIPKTNIVVSGSTLLARTVSITPGRDQFGTSVVTVTVTDAIGQTTNASFILTVLPVNDPPSFDKGADISVLEDCGPRAFAAWASHIRAGPLNESDQGVSFQVSSDNSLLFSSPPVITPNGTLLFEPAPNANGIAHVTVQLHDDGGTANGGSERCSNLQYNHRSGQ